ncbi:NACHT domain-containing protein [Phanerochaete sordida]|uniref:NACHT domain-containing protein n=1 Tax=Phanerochaete sordida TaxID=48140 RepID=A0A9P3GFP6_9APHY|nr:NACHT domain-containing protein [Phanerochaete sordida]
MARSRFRKRDVALDHAPTVLEIVNLVAEIAPVPCLGLVADGLSSVVERVQEARTNSERTATFFEKAKELDTAVVSMVRDANAALEGPGRSALQERLEKLSGTLSDARVSAEKLRGGSGFWGAFKSFVYAKRNEAVLEDLNGQIANAITVFQLRGQAAVEIAINAVGHDLKSVQIAVDNTGIIVDEVSRDIKTVQHTMLSVDEERLIQSIPHAPAGYHSVDELKSGFLEGTREELFEDVETWTRKPLPPPRKTLQQLYLLSGGAGLGKSSAAHQLCVRIAERWGLNLGASFFFVRGGGDLESARYLFSTLAHQLALSQPILRPHIIAAVPLFLKDGEQQQMLKTFERLLWTPLTQFAISGAEQPSTFVVIDGLDECKDRPLVPQLLKCLLQLVRAFPWLRIFVTARPEPHIMPYLTSPSSSHIVHHLSLSDTVAEWREDVANYLRATVPQLESCRDYIRVNPDKLEKLILRAEGVFIYARLAVNFLEAFDDNPEELFIHLLASRESRKLPPLDSLYLQILRLAFPSEYLDIMPERLHRLREVLTFLALRAKNLSPAAIAALLGLSEDNVVRMVDRLRSVLLVDQKGDVVPLHATFAEFLVDGSRCIDPLFYIDRAGGHAILLSRCFTAFSLETAGEFLANARRNSNDGFIGYVRYTSNWHLHLKNARYSTELGQQLQRFVQLQLPVFTRLHGRHDQEDDLAAFLKVHLIHSYMHPWLT